MDSQALIAFIGVVTVISLVPGPDMLYILANGARSGPRAGVVAAVGMSTGLAVHTLAAALGLSALLVAAPAAMDVVRMLGIAFLVYLAIDAFRASKSTMDEQEHLAPKRSLRRVYGMAVATNLGNPKIVLFYLAFLPQFTSTHAPWPIPVQLLVLGAMFIVVGLTVDGAVGLASGRLSTLLTRRRGRRWLARLSGTIFAGLALRLVAEGIK